MLIYTATQEKQWLYHHPSDGHAHLVMFWDLLGSTVYNVPTQYADIDLVAGTHVFGSSTLGRPGPYAGCIHPNGKFYFATSDPGSFSELDPLTGTYRTVRALADKGAQYFALSDDNVIFVGETIKGYVESYDPATDTWTNWGIMDDPGPPYYRYAYTLGADANYIYVGMGQSPWYLVIVNRATNAQTVYWKTSGATNVAVYPGTSGGWYAQVSGGTAAGWYHLTGGAPVLLGSAPSVKPWYNHAGVDFSDGNEPVSGVPAAYGYTLDDTQATPYGIVSGTAPATMSWQSSGGGAVSSVTVSPTVVATNLHQIATRDNANLFCFASAYGPLINYTISGAFETILGIDNKSHYDLAYNPVNARWYLSGYAAYVGKFNPGAAVSPTNPLVLSSLGKYVYRLVIAPDGTVFAGAHHERDSVGGELGWYDPSTDALSSLRTPFLADDISDLIPAMNGTRIVYASNSIVTGGSGKIFVVDAVSKTVLATWTPLPGLSSAGKIVETSYGVIVGVNGTRAYCMDITTGALLWSVTLAATTFPATASYDRRLRLGPDGFVWVPTQNGISRISPSTGVMAQYWSLPSPINILFVPQATAGRYDLYVYGDTHLRRIKNLQF